MTLIQSIVLGLIQGITEFLPVSSSGHLVICKRLFSVNYDIGLDIFLHIATAAALVVYFRKKIIEILGELKNSDRTGFPYIKAIIIGSVPTAVIGLGFKDFFEEKFSQPYIALLMLLVTGLILWVASKYSGSGKPPKTVYTAGISAFIIIGTVQGIAIMPGISRSGITIAAALLLGFKKDSAFEYSMLLSVPAILGAAILQITKINLNAASVLAAIAAFSAGLIALDMLAKAVIHKKLHIFSYYVWTVGIIGIILI